MVNLPLPEMDDCSSRYHCALEKNHCSNVRQRCSNRLILHTDRMLLPIVEPIDRTSKNMNRKTMCTLTWRSTAVRLIGAALGCRYELSRTLVAEKELCSRCIPHQLRLMPCENDKTVRPGRIPDLSASQQELIGTQRNLLRNTATGH